MKLKKRLQTESEFAPECAGKRLPLFSRISFAVAGFCALLFVAFMISEPFADFFNRYISSVFRAVFAWITNFIPFSLAEMILLLSPVIVVFMVRYASKKYCDSWRDAMVFCGAIASVLAIFFSSFTLSFAAAYRGSRLDKKLGIERREVSAEELYETALILTDEVNAAAKGVYFEADGSSLMPYGYGEMNDKLIDAYNRACDKYSFVQRLDSRVKPVMLSGLMSYTHITGVYTFFTGEANLNVKFPDYTLPFTAAHELSHQRGVAREDEANFMAFLVSIESEDAYIRYSAYLNLYEYVMNALYSADRELYYDVYSRLSISVRAEQAAYARFYEKYRDSVASDVSEAVNNTFLTMQGTEGTRSYGMVVDLAVAYYLPKK
ncbi:MAG: DUF3810 domain-containing protein [Clostridia bacterium]|nr:DUF3810 domain-containing protein [Clostridia bacterium]